MRAAAGFQAVPSGTASDWAAEGMGPTAFGLVGCSSLGWSVHDRHKGVQGVSGCATALRSQKHWTEPSTLLRPASVLSHPSSIFHLPTQSAIRLPAHRPHRRQQLNDLTTTIPLDHTMLDLDDHQEGPAPDASRRWRGWVAPRQRNQRAMGRHSHWPTCGSSVDDTATIRTGQR